VVTVGYVTKMTVTQIDPPEPKTLCCTHDSRLYVSLKQSYCRSKFYTAGTGTFDLPCSRDLDLDAMTFIYELDPYSVKMYRMCENELSTSRLSKVIV